MSIEALNWALNKKLPANQKLCLICVAAKAGAKNVWTTWSGSEFEIHLMTGLSEQAVKRAMERLERRNLLVEIGQDSEVKGYREYGLGLRS